MKLKFIPAILLLLLLVFKTEAQTKQTKPQPKKTTAAKKPVAKVPAKTTQAKIPVKSTERLVEITTDFGVMIAKLYDSTPLHRDNFIKLAQQQFYDSLLFHRVIENFMIQGGDPTSKYAAENVAVGSGALPGDRIPAEIRPYLFHKKGSLAAARDNNPAKASSNCQFYIVQGKRYPATELEDVFNKSIQANNPGFKYSNAQKETYARLGGAPFLDQNYTVFGEVISGLEVIDKIAKVAKGPNDRPLQNVRMKIRLLN